MPHKKKNLELEFGRFHNPPEQFYFRFKNITLISRDSFSTPTVYTHPILRLSTVKKVYEWEKENKLEKKTMLEWVDLIQPLVHIFDLSEEERKDLFSVYLETVEAKLNEAIEATKKAIQEIWNEEVRLIDEYNFLSNRLQYYEEALKMFKEKHKRTGKYKLIYDSLRPLIDRFEADGKSRYRQERLLSDLFKKFNFDDFDDFIDKSDPLQSVRNILKMVHTTHP